MRTQWICKLCAFCLLGSVVWGQVTEQATRNRQTALLSLQQLRASLNEIEPEDQRIQAQMQLADLLWTHDERQARQLFADAFQQAFAIPPKASAKQDATQGRVALGFALLARLARHDATWAAQLVESLPEATALSPNLGLPDLKARLQGALTLQRQAALTKEMMDSPPNNNRIPFLQAELGGQTTIGIDSSFELGAPTELASLSLLSTTSSTAQPSANPQLDAVQSIFNGDFKQARNLAEKINDPEIRRQFEGMIGSSEISAFIAASKYDEALSRVQELAAPLERIAAFVQVANAVRGKKGALRAGEILSLAQQSLSAEKESLAKAQAFIVLAATTAELEVERGFELTQTAITTLNALHKEAVPPPLALSEESGLEQLLGRLSSADFSRTWGLAMNINDRELAWFTKLMICRAILAETEDRQG